MEPNLGKSHGEGSHHETVQAGSDIASGSAGAGDGGSVPGVGSSCGCGGGLAALGIPPASASPRQKTSSPRSPSGAFLAVAARGQSVGSSTLSRESGTNSMRNSGATLIGEAVAAAESDGGIGITTARRRKTKYPISDCLPSSPSLVLADEAEQAWRARVEAAHVAMNPHATLEFDDQPDPPLHWYGLQLQRLCGHAASLAGKRFVRLQEMLLPEGGLQGDGVVPTFLKELCTLLCTASYVTQLVQYLLTLDIDAPLEIAGRRRRVASTLGLGRNFFSSLKGASPKSEPSVPLPAKSVRAAFAAVNLEVARLQAAGSWIAAVIDRMNCDLSTLEGDNIGAASWFESWNQLLNSSAENAGIALGGRGADGGVIKVSSQFYLVVPCLEGAFERLWSLIFNMENWPAVSSRDQKSGWAQPSSIKSEMDDADGLEITHDAVEEATGASGVVLVSEEGYVASRVESINNDGPKVGITSAALKGIVRLSQAGTKRVDEEIPGEVQKDKRGLKKKKTEVAHISGSKPRGPATGLSSSSASTSKKAVAPARNRKGRS
eukprot:TRINITY_DN75238_c0_g1_i1.p1 TRINITY_DN75238_c0_g1~~TRINITY_DN75238_c0_g1_i1.p1  ORF type:complete len:549 (+),score=101.64 TRINITY_DN75238_c0_g1_i1:663-2309(+)